MEWLFVDDTNGDRQSFADALSSGELVVSAISGGETRERLANKNLKADGILMDIDLSNETGHAENGVALTASIRAAQNRDDILSFPVVRFSYRARVAKNIGHDASSDDFFDLAIDKDGLSASGVTEDVRSKLRGTADVYRAVALDTDMAALMGLNVEQWAILGHSGFDDDLLYANRPHLKAGIVVRALENPGLLIDERLLATRLGVDRQASSGWDGLLSELMPVAYSGVGAASYRRWWAQALELWWSDKLDVEEPLSAYTIGERVGILGQAFDGLVPLVMPRDSPGERPWRLCTLTMEKDGAFLPVDPAYGVPYRPRSPLPDWLDPTYAALGPAIKQADDPRLDRDELTRQAGRMTRK
jgi:CheY-like chemotaxis protein